MIRDLKRFGYINVDSDAYNADLDLGEETKDESRTGLSVGFQASLNAELANAEKRHRKLVKSTPQGKMKVSLRRVRELLRQRAEAEDTAPTTTAKTRGL